MTFQSFINQNIGKKLDVDKAPNGKIYQCVDVIKAVGSQVWELASGAVGYSGGAKDIMKSNAVWTDDKVDRIKNTPAGVPPVGACIVFDSAPLNPAGHTASVVQADFKTVTVFEQNGGLGNGFGLGSDACRYKTYKYTTNGLGVGKVLGWVVPKNGLVKGRETTLTPAWVNPRGEEQQARFSYINDLNKLYAQWVASGKCDKEVADTLADRDNEIKNYKTDYNIDGYDR